MTEPTEKHLAVLKKYFGHKEFRPMQWKIIRSIIEEQRDNCVVMATGYGKSLCYQYPPVFCGGLGIVISPLISLMQDQVLSLKMRNIPACFVGSAQSEKSLVYDQLLNGHYRLVYVTPEWCTNESGIDILEKLVVRYIKVTLIAIDEAHCVSQWGHDFRKSYRNLGKLRKIFPDVPIVTLTATATPQVRHDIISSLKLRNPQEVTTSFDRPNLFLSVSLKGPDLLNDIKWLLNKQKIENVSGSTIIYCPTKKIADKAYSALRGAGFKCNMYHAGLSAKIRERAHNEFVKDVVDIIIATVAFGMGIDKPDVRSVIHYGAPKDMESYYQEIGRAGRDGLPSLCHTFYAQTDFTLNRTLIASLTGEFKAHKEDMERMMERYLQTSECRRKILLKHFNPSFKLDESRDLKSCCDNCVKNDRNCSKPNIDYDLTEDAILLLKAVNEMNGKYGLTTYIYLIRGSTNKRLPERFHSSNLFGAGRQKTEPWWKLLGGLLLRESLLEENISDFGQGWNKNHFPVKIVKSTQKGNLYLKTNGETSSLEPTPEMLTMIHKMPRKTQDGWMEVKKPLDCEITETTTPMSMRNAPLEDALFDELLKFRTKIADELHCMPYMVLDNRSIQDLTVKRPKSIEELSSIEGINEAKINNFGKECLECIANVINSHSSGKSSSEKVVSTKRFMKNFIFKPSTSQSCRLEYEEENKPPVEESKNNSDDRTKEVISEYFDQAEKNSVQDQILEKDIEESFSEELCDQDLLSALEEVELKAHSSISGKATTLDADRRNENISNNLTVTEASTFKRKRSDNALPCVENKPTLIKSMIQINEEKKKANKKKIKI